LPTDHNGVEEVVVHAQQLITPGPIGSRPLAAVDLADPIPGDGEVVVEVSACAVCRTDLQIVEGDLAARRLPLVPGHQAVGRVLAVGAGVTDRAPGDRVGVAWLAETCGVCRFCTTARENLCEQARFTGWDRDGGYATGLAARADFTFAVPEGFGDVAATPLLCGGVIGYRSLKVSGIRPGGRLGLFGFGASALLAIQVAVHWGCEVFVATRSDAEQRRALEMGAVWAGGYGEQPPVKLDAAVTFAPSGDVVLAALRAVDRGGTVAINAIHLDRVPQFPYELLWWERRLCSVANFTRLDATEFLDLAATVPVRTVVADYPLDRANEALADLAAGRVDGAAVLIN
jgi:propanol-preferring alcohol dehydrogenase